MNSSPSDDTSWPEVTWSWGEFAGVSIWGCLIASWLVRGFLGHAPGEICDSHETHSYVYRLIEFRELLAAGYLSPQWCSDFRGGLGGPYFSYYQPGFFYVASLPAMFLDPVSALGAAEWLFGLAGYMGMYLLVRREFGGPAALLSASAFVLSVYAGTDLYVRGDLSEFAAMMLIPPLAWAMWSWLSDGRGGRWLTMVILACAVAITHPCVTLMAYLCMPLLTVAYACVYREWRRGIATLLGFGAGAAMAGFYWVPVFREWHLVAGDRAFAGFYGYDKHFVAPILLVGPYTRETIIPFTLGQVVPLLLAWNCGWLIWQWSRLSNGQRSLAVGFLALLIFCVFLISPWSQVVWQFIRPLQRLQFPWRLLVLVSVAAAGLCGISFAQLKMRTSWLASSVVSLLLLMLSIIYTMPYPPIRFREVETASEIAEQSVFAPDLMGEWVPVGAAIVFPKGIPNRPQSDPKCEIRNFETGIGRMSMNVATSQEAQLVLPHYFFPVGWRVQFNHNPIELTADGNGLMQLTIPANAQGVLELKFQMTPARRLGWLVSTLAFLAALAGTSLASKVLSRRSASPDFANAR